MPAFAIAGIGEPPVDDAAFPGEPAGTRERESVLRPPRRPVEPVGWRAWIPGVVGFGIPFLLIAALGAEAGGYNLVFRSQVGIIVWWGLLVGLLAGLLPAARVTRAGWITASLFGGLVAITAVGALTWTESAERSVIELSRNLTIFGAFLLLLLIQGRDGLRRSLAAVGVATALIAVVALTDRFEPGLLPFGQSATLPEGYPVARLAFPLEYWNGLAGLMAIGVAPLVWLATNSRERLGGSLAAGAIPLVILATYLTASRGGTASLVLAGAAMLALFPERLRLAFELVVPVLASILLIVLINDRPEIRDALPGDVAASQGSAMFIICLVAYVLVAAAHMLLRRPIESVVDSVPGVGRRPMWFAGGAIAAAMLVAFSVSLATGFLADRWAEFKNPAENAATVSRLANLNSGERYLYWDSAVDAASSEKLTGIGPGAYEYWWARQGSGTGFARDAHSLYLEALAEMGPLAFLLAVGLVFGPIAYVVALSVRGRSTDSRAALAAAGGGLVAFALFAGLDWAWELTVLPVAFFALVAAVAGPDTEPPEIAAGQAPSRNGAGLPMRLLAALCSLAAIAVIAVPMVGTQAFFSSKESVARGELDEALTQAERASDAQPWAASPKIQQAQVLELMGRDREAADLARQAVADERTNWRNWFVLSQTLADSSPVRSRLALRRALRLNPRSAVLRAEVEGLGESR